MATLKVPVTLEDHIEGNEHAPITLVEYGDYQCPYCRMAAVVVKQLQSHFGDQLKFVFRNFPLANVHPLAEVAAETAEFASEHGLFWEMHDLIYANQDNLSVPFLLELAETLNLSTIKLKNALENRTYEPKVKKDFIGGVRSGVNGTPTFYIQDQRYNGPNDFESLSLAISSVLKDKTVATKRPNMM